jgi:hypothetical protein
VGNEELLFGCKWVGGALIAAETTCSRLVKDGSSLYFTFAHGQTIGNPVTDAASLWMDLTTGHWSFGGVAPTTHMVDVTGDTHATGNVLADGNAGVGTASPNNRLEVQDNLNGAFGGGTNDQSVYIKNSNTGNTATVLTLASTGGANFNIMIVGSTTVEPNWVIFDQRNNAPMVFMTNNATVMTILGNGKVGFGGNTSPGYAVDVTGDVNVSGALRVGGVQIAPRVVAAPAQWANQAANIGATNLLASAPAGMYRISLYGSTHTAGTGNVSIVMGWNDGNSAKTATVPMLLTAGSSNAGTIPLYAAAGTNITLVATYVATGSFDLIVRLEAE